MRLKDVLQNQPKRDRIGSGSRNNRKRNINRNGDREGTRNRRKKSSLSRKKKGSLIRPGASIQTASRRRLEKTIELDSDTDEESSMEDRYQNPKRISRSKVVNVDNEEDDDESSKESDEEDEIPYRMNFSQPTRKAQKDRDSSSSDDDDGGYDSPSDTEEKTAKKRKSPCEPLRPGDVIEYENTMIFTAGSGRGHNTAKVLGTAPESKFPLKLSTGDYLDASVRIRRTHECIKGTMYRHAGYWKPISSFRLRKRLLRNADGTPVEAEGGVYGKAKAFRNMRDNMHQKAVEFVRGDHDDRIGIGNAGNFKTNDRSPKKIAAKALRAGTNVNAKNDEDDASSKSSSSSDDSELRLEYERLKAERKSRLQQTEKKQSDTPKFISIRKSPPLSMSDSSESGSDSDNEIHKPKQLSPLTSSSSKPSLGLKKIPRTTASSTKKNSPELTKDEVYRVKPSNNRTNTKFHLQNNLYNKPSSSNSEKKSPVYTQDEVCRAKPSDNRTNTKFHLQSKSYNKTKCIDTSIDLDSQTIRQRHPKKLHVSDHLSLSSSSSHSSTRKMPARTSPFAKKRPSRPSRMGMTTVASKEEEAKRFDELLDEDSDSSDDDSLLLENPVYSSPKNIEQTRRKSPPTTASKKNHSDRSKKSSPSAASVQSIQSFSKDRFRSPVEENPVDLFEDSSVDDNSSSGESICRRRNRRGERILRSPSVDLLHRKHKQQTNLHTGWLTQEHDDSKERRLAPSKKPPSPARRAVKRSVVVSGYQPLPIAVNGIQEEDVSSPPSLAKAYRKREEKKQRENEEQCGKRNFARNESVSKQRDNERRTKEKKIHERSNQRRDAKCLDKGESNRRRLQREKEKLKKHTRPPPYPTERSDPHFADMSTQEENEWSDLEQDDELSCSHHRSNNTKYHKDKKRKGSKTREEFSASSSLTSVPTPSKRSRVANNKRNTINASKASVKFSSLSSINDSEEEEEEEKHTRKRLTPKSRVRNRGSESKTREARNQKQEKRKRYELSPSSASSVEVQHQKTPRTPWSTDCEVDSPLPSTIKVAKIQYGVAHRDPTTKGSSRSSRKNKKVKRSHNGNTLPSVFEFASQDENEDPDGRYHKQRHLAPKLTDSTKKKSRKPKSNRKIRAR